MFREKHSLYQRGRRGGGGAEEEEEEETPEELQLKVYQLQGYVRELTEHYKELMDAFEKLKERQGESMVSLPATSRCVVCV